MPSCALVTKDFNIKTRSVIYSPAIHTALYSQSEPKTVLAEESSYRSLLVFCGTPQRGHAERTWTVLQECEAIFRLFVLILCHRPVHTQTRILSRSAPALSLVCSAAEVRGNHVSLSYTSTYRTPGLCFHNSTDIFCCQASCYPSCMFHGVCMCVQTVPRSLVSDLLFLPLFLYFITQGQ